MAFKRIAKEKSDYNKLENKTFSMTWSSDFSVIVNLEGPVGTPYEGGIFKFRIDLPNHYPFK